MSKVGNKPGGVSYDLHVEVPLESLSETIEIAKRLGWNGIGLIVEEGKLAEFRQEIIKYKGRDFDIVLGVKIEPKRASDIPKRAREMRRRVELVVVRGGAPEINRAALETPDVDVLLSPGSGAESAGSSRGSGCGLNHVLARLGKKNNVAIGFGLNALIYSYKKTRAQLLSGIEEAAGIVKRFRCPFILSSDAASPWDLRSPSELVSFGRVLGFRDPDIRKALSDAIVRENRKRLSGKWLMPGVEVV